VPSALPAGPWRGDAEPLVVDAEAVPVSPGPTLSRVRPGLSRTSPNGTGQVPWFRPYLSGGHITAAAPQPPGAWPPVPVSSAPLRPTPVSSVSSRDYVPAPATRPMPPVDPIPMPGPIPMPATPFGSTPLPRRVPGEQLPATARLSAPASSSFPPVPAPRSSVEDDAGGVTVGLDPERIRSRLSAYAEGVSAAARRGDSSAPVQRDH
jgi:hypothetical protein